MLSKNAVERFKSLDLKEEKTIKLEEIYKAFHEAKQETEFQQEIIDEIMRRESTNGVTHEEESEENYEERGFVVGERQTWDKITEIDNKKQWIWENYIAKGNITLLSALWKAGKSTFLRQLFLAIAQQKEFAGQPTSKSNILIISEEDTGEWYEQKEGLEDNEISHITIWSRPLVMKPNTKQWQEFIVQLSEICKKDDINLIVFDTISTFFPLDNENDAAQVTKSLVPLYRFTKEKIAVVLVHHFRKKGGDEAQASRGSGALPSFVDNIIEFTRTDNGVRTQRELTTYGRFDAVVPKVVIDLINDEYVTLGEPWVVSKSARMNKIIEVFEENNETLSVKQVYGHLTNGGFEINERSVRRFVKELKENKILSVVKTETQGRATVPYYHLADDYKGQRTIQYPLGVGVVRASVVDESTDRSNPLGSE